MDIYSPYKILKIFKEHFLLSQHELKLPVSRYTCIEAFACVEMVNSGSATNYGNGNNPLYAPVRCYVGTSLRFDSSDHGIRISHLDFRLWL